jgi:hypothetical protein
MIRARRGIGATGGPFSFLVSSGNLAAGAGAGGTGRMIFLSTGFGRRNKRRASEPITAREMRR